MGNIFLKKHFSLAKRNWKSEETQIKFWKKFSLNSKNSWETNYHRTFQTQNANLFMYNCLLINGLSTFRAKVDEAKTYRWLKKLFFVINE